MPNLDYSVQYTYLTIRHQVMMQCSWIWKTCSSTIQCKRLWQGRHKHRCRLWGQPSRTSNNWETAMHL